ncbi:unnamed protein product [Soboliphyme baturini]|uniref:Uncharacterized protein n=1 Tax=Soboliphyme baturini TaxID=241478 RepID=A0A183J3I6_9BILA|nr:unnamed protein product [Soboliphyme baturini]
MKFQREDHVPPARQCEIYHVVTVISRISGDGSSDAPKLCFADTYNVGRPYPHTTEPEITSTPDEREFH